jgi:hypothetical protein
MTYRFDETIEQYLSEIIGCKARVQRLNQVSDIGRCVIKKNLLIVTVIMKKKNVSHVFVLLVGL